MQEVTSTDTKTSTIFDQLRTSALVDTSSKSRAFSDFLGLMAQPGARSTSQNVSTQINSGIDAVTQQTSALPVSVIDNTQAQQAASAASGASTVSAQVKQNTSDSVSSTAKNAPVSREAFEEAKPLLAKAGYTDKEISDLSARVQAGTLSWGQLVQNLGGHMTGAKKAVSLSASETADLQSLFQKMGFAGNVAADMAQAMGKGDGLKVLSSIQNKLSSMPDDSSLGLDKNELATFFKALRLPNDTANKLTQSLGAESTVADMKNALLTMSQAMQDQRAKSAASDTELAKSLGKIMEKDTAKAARDSSQSIGQTTSASSAQVAYELKTKDKNDTGWFEQRDKAQQEKTQQQKASDESWKGFNSKVRTDETVLQSAASGSQQSAQAAAGTMSATGKDALEALTRAGQSVNAQQGKAETAQQAKAYEKVNAPKVLDQVSEALLKDLGQGRKQMTVQLDPENLGKVQVMLQVKGKEISAVIQTEDAQTAAMLSSNMESLKKTLEDQGLTVQNLEVQAGLTSRQDQQASFSADQHNQAQERQELSRIFSQLRMMRGDGGDVASDMQNMHMQAILADQGLHIIA
ncbi:MAG TPA: flagellar hook-length control protein FliK [Humidesulfovibrio sp.]|uniref:flagellar hook-length control protein FliK n=1 Tax=Humidesulfovibrio sp. TaxID=2910988 RepID=UPI002C58078C|nr:flagellar hook-length control protein FliK [Humidesulfovibrio sp.]HWR04059.1 flagellar hook-length control protein FliK [Humidesulfovibrio sp.]